MTTKRHHIANKWHMWCADCGAKNHQNASECSRCGYGRDGQAFGVRNVQNVGKPEYTSDGEAGRYNRSVDTDTDRSGGDDCG